MAREITQGTATFAWTQGLTRRRWAAGQLLRLGVPLALGALAVGLIISWWAAPFTGDRLTSSLFDLYPPVYVGWALVAFTLGALLGTVLREPASAIVLTLACLYVMLILVGAASGSYLDVPLNDQSPDRFWALQAVVAGGLVTVSGLLAAASIWLVRRRPA